MNPEFGKCVEERGIFRFEAAKHLASDELKDAKEDLEKAEKELTENSYKWATVKGYYAMFHAARALLYVQGYREKTHYCLAVGIKAFYVATGQMDLKLVEDLNNARRLRERANYRGNYSKEGGDLVVLKAKEFVGVAEKILSNL